MLRNDVSYPYPVLRTEAIDYSNTIFSDQMILENTTTGYRLITNFSVNNESINRMINDGVLSYAVFISCKSTLLREMRYVDPTNPVINIDAVTVHYHVNYIAYIIVTQDISHYSNDDFVEEYKNIDFKLSKGAVVGIGTERQFRAVFDKDVISDAASIINVSGSDQEQYMKIELDNRRIEVVLPADQCSAYKNCQGRKQKYALLHSVIVIPALMEAITTIRSTEDDDDLAKQPWFITLQQQISKLAVSRNESEQLLYENPLRTAQIIMNNNSGIVLKQIEEQP